MTLQHDFVALGHDLANAEGLIRLLQQLAYPLGIFLETTRLLVQFQDPAPLLQNSSISAQPHAGTIATVFKDLLLALLNRHDLVRRIVGEFLRTGIFDTCDIAGVFNNG